VSIKKRKYKSYKQYLAHQSSKLSIGVSKNIDKFKNGKFDLRVKFFKRRLKEMKKYMVGPKVLCLGARLGEEVVAWRQLGFPETIGIDINPGLNNEYVIKDDFHNMSFESESFNAAYTNSLDHVWDLRDLSKEISRILVPGGRLILEIFHNKKGQQKVVKSDSKYESIMWKRPSEVKSYF